MTPGEVAEMDSMNGAHSSHAPQTIYADYQATTPVDPRVFDVMAPYWGDLFGNPHSSDHLVGWRTAEAVHSASSSVAALIGADPDEVIFTSGATEANNLALLGLARRAPPTRRHILVSAIEHKCVLAAARSLEEREGFAVQVIPVDKQGFVNLEALDAMLNDSVLVVSVMAVNNEIGTIQDIPRIASLAADYGVFFHCDAAQAPSAIDLSCLASQADLISLSGHKMYGPQGVGVLYIRRGLHKQVEPLIYGGGQQAGLRSGTVPVALSVGMGAAADIICLSDRSSERRRVAGLRDDFVERLRVQVPSLGINGPTGSRRHPGNANLRFGGQVAQDILGALQPHVAASTGAACTSGIPEPSHVLRAIGLSATEAEASIRFSFGRFTTEDEVEEAVHYVQEALEAVAEGI